MSGAVHIETDYGRGTVYPTAALFTDIEFKLPSGRWVRPMATAPWGEALDPAIPGHLRRLGGEFFCLPFGGGGTVRDPVAGWESLTTAAPNEPMHGPAANADWEIIAHDRHSVSLSLDLPEDYLVSRIERRIALSTDRPFARSTVTLEIRREGRLPVAFHPILRLPEKSVAARSSLPPLPRALPIRRSSSQTAWPASPAENSRACRMCRNVAAASVDLSHLPLGPRVDDVVLLAGMNGPLRAAFS